MEVRPSKPAAAFGLAVGVVFILLGLFVVIPQFGPFGLLWTAVALIITILNGVNAFSERGVPSGVIHIEDEADGLAPPPAAVPPQPSSPAKSPEERLETLRGLHQQGLITAEEYDRRRRYLVENLNRIGLSCFEPKGAFYVFPDIRGTGLSSEDFCERFLMEEKVAVIAGNAFGAGGEGFVRCCYATSMKDIAEALTRMDNFLTNLKKKQARERGE